MSTGPGVGTLAQVAVPVEVMVAVGVRGQSQQRAEEHMVPFSISELWLQWWTQYLPTLWWQGGGRMKIEILDWLTVDGHITANGGDWRSVGAGGGSGGSILIHTKVIDGTGVIEAHGGGGYDGSHAPHGGGGAGGRVAMYYVARSLCW